MPDRSRKTSRDTSGRQSMKRSTERFLTTHTGSLPRPEDLVRMMYAREEGVPVDRAELGARVRSAVEDVVHKQAAAGVDIVNDGEMSKPSYATYVKDRLNGFGGTGNTFVYQDLVEFPNLAKRVFGDPGRSRRKTPGCNAPISVRDAQSPRDDVDNLKAGFGKVNAQEMFMSAASPGVIGLFFRNDHYPSQEAYLFAVADAMRHEYETVAKAGIVLQIDCPDLAMGRHIQYADLPLDEFRKKARLHVEALNHATANIAPERMRMHLCWGNYEGPHHCDVPLERKTNFIEHPELVAQRIGRYAKLVGRENVIAGSDCGYGTWVGQAAVDPDVVWAKMAAMAEGARIASKEFWKR